MIKRINIIALFVSIALFIFSLTQDAYCTTNLCRSSIDAFLTGIVGMMYGGAAITWLANPILITSWIFIKRNTKLSMILSVASVIISLSFLFFKGVVDNEAGHVNLIIRYKFGYWLWLSSTIVIMIGNLTLYFESIRLSKGPIEN